MPFHLPQGPLYDHPCTSFLGRKLPTSAGTRRKKNVALQCRGTGASEMKRWSRRKVDGSCAGGELAVVGVMQWKIHFVSKPDVQSGLRIAIVVRKGARVIPAPT